MPRPTFPIVFGGGLDRSSGTLVSDSRRMEVLENAYLLDGRLEPRGGNELRSASGEEYTILIAAETSELRGVVVIGANEPGAGDHAMGVWTCDGDGTDIGFVNTWVSPCLSVERAKAFAAQSGARVFLAHEEALLSRRAHTIWYDAPTNLLQHLLAEWARGGDEEVSNQVRFRGVVSWLSYLVGWGFGTNLTDMPHMVRISEPDQPDVFLEDAYVTAGQPGEPVQVCLPLDRALLILKETSAFILSGYDANSFGLLEVDKRFGAAAPRLACVEGGTAYVWTLEGPRTFSGGPSEDISWPLGLPWPSAEMIAAEGLLSGGWAEYVPRRRLVVFVFGTWVYAYDLRRKEWAHWVLQFHAHCGGILYATTGYAGMSRGYPDFNTVEVVDVDSRRVKWHNILAEGDETVEVWVREVGGSWPGSPTAEVDVGVTPQVVVDALAPGDYEVALRYDRNGVYSANYGGSPETWPAVSRGTFTVAEPAVPAISALVWSRTAADAEQIAVTYAGLARVRIYRNTVNNHVGSTLVHTSAGSAGTYADVLPAGEVVYWYFVRNFYVDDSVGSAVSAGQQRYAGPDAPSALLLEAQTTTFYSLTFTPADAAYETEVWDDDGAGGALALRTTLGAGEDNDVQSVSAPNAGNVVDVEIRHKVTAFGVDDFSVFVAGSVDL